MAVRPLSVRTSVVQGSTVAMRASMYLGLRTVKWNRPNQHDVVDL